VTPKAATKAATKAAPRTKAAPPAKAAQPKPAIAPRPRPVTPAKRSGPLDKFLLEQRALLHEERVGHTRQAESLRAEAEQLAAEMEPGDIQFDEESGEGATMNVERERDLALSAQNRAAVDEIDRALAKIDIGTYGLCEQCGQPIPRPRLKALPYAALCVACKSGGLSRR
jgi:DnaK suppressor protein